jgi:hypothetical protein
MLTLIAIRFTFSIILSVVYDHEPKAKDDAVVGLMQRFLEATVSTLTPGATVIIEAFPFRMSSPAMVTCMFFIL